MRKEVCTWKWHSSPVPKYTSGVHNKDDDWSLKDLIIRMKEVTKQEVRMNRNIGCKEILPYI